MSENESRPGPAASGGRQPHQRDEQQYGQYGRPPAGPYPLPSGQASPQGAAGMSGGQPSGYPGQQVGQAGELPYTASSHAGSQPHPTAGQAVIPPHFGQPAAGPVLSPSSAQPPVALAGPGRKRAGRMTAIIGATALAAALIGGGAGAAIVGLTGSDSAGSAATSSSVTGQTVSNTTSSGDVSAVAAKVVPSVVQVNVTTSQGQAIGSGVILTSDGRILTNAHVVEGAQNVTITTSDGKKYQASVVGSDTKGDIAVLQAQGAGGLTAATLGDSSKLVVGQEVVAIVSPASAKGPPFAMS